MIIQLNKIQYPVYNLGPGKRMGIWLQGCSINCSDCINKSTWPADQGKSIHILDLYNIIETICKDYDGITITGGEPFDQYLPLMTFSFLIKRKTSLNILCYSGYYLEELVKKFPDKAFCHCFDFLVDGRYDKTFASSNSLKGSENQNIYEFVDKNPVQVDLVNTDKKWSIRYENDTLYMAGIPMENEMEQLTNGMSSKGFNIKLV